LKAVDKRSKCKKVFKEKCTKISKSNSSDATLSNHKQIYITKNASDKGAVGVWE